MRAPPPGGTWAALCRKTCQKVLRTTSTVGLQSSRSCPNQQRSPTHPNEAVVVDFSRGRQVGVYSTRGETISEMSKLRSCSKIRTIPHWSKSRTLRVVRRKSWGTPSRYPANTHAISDFVLTGNALNNPDKYKRRARTIETTLFRNCSAGNYRPLHRIPHACMCHSHLFRAQLSSVLKRTALDSCR